MEHEGSDDVYERFARWLDAALASAPTGATAFYFNLYEYEDAFSIQVVTTRSFKDDDPEWAVNPILFMPEDYLFFLDRHEGEEDWMRALQEALDLVRRYLAEGASASVLKASSGVGCAFVDGDEYIVWRAPSN